MKTRSLFCSSILATVMSLAVGCNGGGSSGGSTAKEPVPTSSSMTSDDGSTATDTSATDVAPEVTQAACPGGLVDEAVFKNYKAIGIEVEVDCAAMGTSNYFYHYRLSDLGETLKVLERSLDLFKQWPQRPAKIVIGERAYHSSKDNLIQVPYVVSRPQDLEDYLHDTRLLMDLEITEFNRNVRFSYVTYDLARNQNGEKFDVGTGSLIGYGAAREQLVKDDIARVRKMKKSIQQMPLRNVRLTHANQMESFIVSQWSESYSLPTEYTDAQLAPYFKYLAKLANVQKSFGAIEVSVIVPVYPALEIERAIQALDVLAGTKVAKVAFEKRGVKSVHVSDISLSDMHRRFRVSKRNNGLTIDNLYGYDGKIQTAAQLADCLEKADFDTAPTYFCDGRGALRY